MPQIFSVIEPLLVANDVLMTMMERRLKKWGPYQKFGDVFLKDYMVRKAIEIYSVLRKRLAGV